MLFFKREDAFRSCLQFFSATFFIALHCKNKKLRRTTNFPSLIRTVEREETGRHFQSELDDYVDQVISWFQGHFSTTYYIP